MLRSHVVLMCRQVWVKSLTHSFPQYPCKTLHASCVRRCLCHWRVNLHKGSNSNFAFGKIKTIHLFHISDGISASSFFATLVKIISCEIHSWGKLMFRSGRNAEVSPRLYWILEKRGTDIWAIVEESNYILYSQVKLTNTSCNGMRMSVHFFGKDMWNGNGIFHMLHNSLKLNVRFTNSVAK